MSEENVEVVRRAMDAWNEGGPEQAKQFWAEDSELHDVPSLPDSRVVRGKDAVAAHFADVASVVGEMKATIVDVRAQGETVVMRVEMTVRGTQSGVGVPGEVTQVVEVADGRIQRARFFRTWEEALEAAGLEE